MSRQLLLSRQLDANGDPAPGAKANIFETGTTTPVTVYQDTDLNTAHPNPIVADAEGRFPQAFYGGSLALKVVYTDAADATLATFDPAPLLSIAVSAAADITVAPFTGVTDTNVQDALETIQENISAAAVNAQTLVETGGSSNAYTLIAAQTITTYTTGERFLVRINHENTGAATLNIDGIGATAWRKYSGNSIVDLASGDLKVGDIQEVVYDGTRLILLARTSGGAAPEEHIVTKTYSSGGVIDFTETNASRYLGYKFRLLGASTSFLNSPSMLFSTNGGSSYVSSSSAYQVWSDQRDDNDGTSAPSYAELDRSDITLGNVAGFTLANGEVTILLPHSTTVATTLNGYWVSGSNTVRNKAEFSAMRRSATEAHNAFRFRNLTAGTISMIGIRNFS